MNIYVIYVHYFKFNFHFNINLQLLTPPHPQPEYSINIFMLKVKSMLLKYKINYFISGKIISGVSISYYINVLTFI
jgi:hypothetical protein